MEERNKVEIRSSNLQSGTSAGIRKVIINVSLTKYELIRSIAERQGWSTSSKSDSKNWDLFWSDSAVHPETLSKMLQYQKINHFPGMFMLSRKNCLAKNLNNMQKKHPSDYNFYPKTWVLPSEFPELSKSSPKVYIIKPVASSQGKGIYLTKSLDHLGPNDRCVVQEYIKDPFLIDGCKFDMRIYVLLTGCCPLRAFVHTEGLVRLATKPYVLPNSSNLNAKFVHLTNYAINKNSEDFVHSQNLHAHTGHKRSLSSAFAYLKDRGFNTAQLWQDIKGVIIKTLFCIQPKLAHIYKASQPSDFSNSMCFEILGFDILVDSKLVPWLLEVNHSPSFKTDSELDLSVKTSVIEEALDLININKNNRREYEKYKKKNLFLKTFCSNKEDVRQQIRLESIITEFKREQWESKHAGAYETLYPLQREHRKYEVLLTSAKDVWERWTGVLDKNKIESNPTSPRFYKRGGSLDSDTYERLAKPTRCRESPKVAMPHFRLSHSNDARTSAPPMSIQSYSNEKSPNFVLPKLEISKGRQLRIKSRR